MLLRIGEKYESVDSVHPDYASMVEHWQQMKDVTSCEKVIHDSGEKYLPKLPEMTTTQYSAYTLRASFPLFTKHTLNNFVGMSMRKDVMCSNVPELFIRNINGAGSSLTEYVKKLVRAYLTYGRCGTHVEYAKGSERTKALLYPAEKIRNWSTRIVNDVEVLSMVVLHETTESSSDPFLKKPESRYRVLLLDEADNKYKQVILDNTGVITEISIPTKNHKPLDYIPFIIHGGWEVDYPPLQQIAEQNLVYYRLDADYKHGLHYVSLPTPYTVGVEDTKDRPNTLGCSKIWHLPDESTCGMLEFSGAGLGEIATAKEEVHERIVTLSSRILAPPRNLNETATAAAIRNAGDTASLAEIIGTLSREMTKILQWMTSWQENSNTQVSVAINNDFIPTILSGSDVASYVASYLKGGMSFYTLFHTLKRGEIQEGDRELAEELEDIRKEILERQVNEVALAEKLASIESKISAQQQENVDGQTPKEKSDYIQQGREGEQTNKGQMKEN